MPALELAVVVGEVHVAVGGAGDDYGNPLVGELVRQHVAAVGDGPEVGEGEVALEALQGGGLQVLADVLPAAEPDPAGFRDIEDAAEEIVLEPADVGLAVGFHQGLAGR